MLVHEDDVPLTEQERENVDRLLAVFNVLPTLEGTKTLMVTDSIIEVLQHGLFLVKHVLESRHRYQVDNDDTMVYREGTLDSLRRLRAIYAKLESAKDQEAI